jgi:hypothetical protein
MRLALFVLIILAGDHLQHWISSGRRSYPVSGEEMEYAVPMPADMAELLEGLRKQAKVKRR